MLRRALLSALGLWAREPRAMLVLNVAFAAVVLASIAAMAAMGLRASIVPVAAWLFLTLLRAVYLLLSEETLPWKLPLAGFFKGTLLEGLWLGLLFLGVAALMAVCMAGGLQGLIAGGFAAWLGLAGLFALGLAAPEGQAWWKATWAGLLAAVAFLPSALGAAAIVTWLSGFLGLWIGTKHWSAALLWAPLILFPLFTPSFLAAFLNYLAQGVRDVSRGKAALESAPSFMEILRPWR